MKERRNLMATDNQTDQLELVFSTELVEKLDAKAAKRLWKALVVKDVEGNYYTQQEYWSVKKNGEEGKHTLTALTKITKKNIGRSNETSEKEQAIKEAISLYNKSLDGVLNEDNFLPMLAQPYSTKKAAYPAYIQPKIDGIRCIVKPNKTFWTRKGKLIPPNIVQHITEALPDVNYILDGELVLPTPFTFQESVSAVKKYGENTSKLILCVYDAYLTTPYSQRYETLINLSFKSPLYLCPTEKVVSEEDFLTVSAFIISEGYEGSIYRNREGLYKPNVRSFDLLKYKDFNDDEFEIINVLEGKGKELGCAIFECQGATDTFTVRPKGTEEYRRQLWADRKNLIGQQLTVKYMGFTDENLPRFPVGISVRNYE
jgi:ATP-dependent DNA ligase